MSKRRGYPDRRAMGAQSDFLSETFVPSREHRAAQALRARALIASGFSLEEVGAMLSIPVDQISAEALGADGSQRSVAVVPASRSRGSEGA